MNPVKIGIIGCGNVSKQYFENCKKFKNLSLLACADLDVSRAQDKATEFAVERAMSVEDLLSDDEIEAVINLTIPEAHHEIDLLCLEHGKAVYSEKPFAVYLEDGKRVLDKAEQQGILVGCAPDTVLGGGLQTARKLIEDGWIGQPVAATAFMLGHGPEGWHPNPEPFYRMGGGPHFDFGPYYISALVNCLGPVRRVVAMAKASFPERVSRAEGIFGKRIPVTIPTHVTGCLEFHSGVIATLVLSFDVWGSNTPRIEIYGTEGTIVAPDPNTFAGPVLYRKQGSREFENVPILHPHAFNSRGLGMADMAVAMRTGRKHRASGYLAYHVLDVIHGLTSSAQHSQYISLLSWCEKPDPMPYGYFDYDLPWC